VAGMEKSDNKKTEILDAAMQCLARYGAKKTTLDDIAHLIGLNKATLYYYYENKEAIFIDALDREAQQFINMVLERFKKNDSASAKLYTFLRAYYNYVRDRAEILELNAQALVDNHAFIRKIQTRMREKNVDLMKGIIREGINKGEFRNINAGRVADILRNIFDLRLLEFFILYVDNGHKNLDVNRLENDGKYMLEIFLHGIRIDK
jgi:AcrR family transcriptional regulator